MLGVSTTTIRRLEQGALEKLKIALEAEGVTAAYVRMAYAGSLAGPDLGVAALLRAIYGESEIGAENNDPYEGVAGKGPEANGGPAA